MVTTPFRLLAALCFTALLAASASYGQLNSSTIDRLAIYAANVANRSNLPDSSVTYNVTNPATIDSIFSGIDFTTQRDCRGVEAKNTSYIYVKFKTGSRKIYHLFELDTHMAIEGRRDLCYYIPPPVRSIIAANTQP